MVSVNISTLKRFEYLGNGSAQKGYNAFQINNFNLEGLILFNVVMLILLKLSPIIDKKLKKHNETIEIKGYKFNVLPKMRNVIMSALFLTNLGAGFIYMVFSYVF